MSSISKSCVALLVKHKFNSSLKYISQTRQLSLHGIYTKNFLRTTNGREEHHQKCTTLVPLSGGAPTILLCKGHSYSTSTNNGSSVVRRPKRAADVRCGTKLSENFGENKKMFWKEVKRSENEVDNVGEELVAPLQRSDVDHVGEELVAPLQKSDVDHVGEELVAPLQKSDVDHVLKEFYHDKHIQELALANGLDAEVYREACNEYYEHCQDFKQLPTDLHILLSDVIKGAGHIRDLFPSFLKHAKQVFPHLLCLDELYSISDLSNPATWYPKARHLKRKIIFHAGPTNSGKTYHALQRFLQSESGVYCSPLKMLATEVYSTSNDEGTPCDLVTGEERRYGGQGTEESPHVACTVEMTSLARQYDVAIIDEIQQLRDPMRGWAWTRALLGLQARELHLCGEEAALPLVENLTKSTGEELQVHRYKRLTPLTMEEEALKSLRNVQAGDCIVCFSKRYIHAVTRELEKLGHQVAVIYGGLPPGTKLAQAQKFNDPDHPCKIMVATDAIGMGLNLSIRRVIFYSLVKKQTNVKGVMEKGTLTVSQALQIAGRAGRYGTQWEHGFVTTMESKALPTLRRLMASKPTELEKAGLNPTPDQIELFACRLPSYTLSGLMDIFLNVCTLDKSHYFMCGMEDFKYLANLIQHMDLPLRSRYIFCCAPINKNNPVICSMFSKFCIQLCRCEPASVEWLCLQLNWTVPQPPKNMQQLEHLEHVFDVMVVYRWLGLRFPDIFPDGEPVQRLQSELDKLIEEGVSQITALVSGAKQRLSHRRSF